MEKEIQRILKELKISINTNGYLYWNDLILNVAKKYKSKENSKIKITELYKEMAKKFNTTDIGIEKALKYSIKGRLELIRKYFNYDTYKITNKTFLILVIEKLDERKQKKK